MLRFGRECDQMHPQKKLDLLFECFIIQAILDTLPSDLRSYRDLGIQNNKFMRMLIHPPINSGVIGIKQISAGSSPTKKEIKRAGKNARRLGQQAGEVKRARDKYLKELLLRDDPKMTNAEFRVRMKNFDEALLRKISALKAEPVGEILKGLTESTSKASRLAKKIF
jgi:hypothetical protein